jgi:hypothetical protein
VHSATFPLHMNYFHGSKVEILIRMKGDERFEPMDIVKLGGGERTNSSSGNLDALASDRDVRLLNGK